MESRIREKFEGVRPVQKNTRLKVFFQGQVRAECSFYWNERFITRSYQVIELDLPSLEKSNNLLEWVVFPFTIQEKFTVALTADGSEIFRCETEVKEEGHVFGCLQIFVRD